MADAFSTPTPQQPNMDALGPLFQALAQAMQSQAANAGGRLKFQGQQTFGRHTGMGGEQITPENPLGYAGGSPFSNGFFNQSAASLSPEARQASQGGSAMTKWAGQGQVPGVDPNGLKQVQQHQTPLPGGGYSSYDSVDQFSDPFFQRRLNKMQNPDPFQLPPMGRPLPTGGYEEMINPALPDAQRFKDPNFRQTTKPQTTPLRKGASFRM